MRAVWKYFPLNTEEELERQTTCLSDSVYLYGNTPLVWGSLRSIFPDIIHKLLLCPSTERESLESKH